MIIALLVGSTFGAPQVISQAALGAGYHSVPYLLADAEGEYMTRMQEIIDGHPTAGSAFFHEYKDIASFVPPSGEFLFYVVPHYLTGQSLVSIILIARFVFPAILFLLVYTLIYALAVIKSNRAKLSAIAGALFVVVSYHVIDYASFFAFLKNGVHEYYASQWGRLVNPITGGIFLFLFLNIVVALISTVRKSRRTAIIGGLVLGVMSGYFFSFFLAVVVTLLYFAWYMSQKEWGTVYILIGISCIGALVNSLYVIAVLMTATHATVPNSLYKQGLFSTHLPIINMLCILILCIGGAVFVWYRKTTPSERVPLWWVFVFVMIGSSMLVYTQQLLTGFTIWPSHFAQYTVPLMFVVFTVLVENFIRTKISFLWKLYIVVVIGISLAFVYRTIASVPFGMDTYAELQSYGKVFMWLNTRVGPHDRGCVVYVASNPESELNRFVTALTPCDVYHSIDVFSGVPDSRVMYNYLLDLHLRKIKHSNLPEYLQINMHSLYSTFFRDWVDIFCCGAPGWLGKIRSDADIQRYFDGVKNSIIAQYTAFESGDLYAQLTKYQITYLVVDPTQQDLRIYMRLPFLKYEATLGRFVMYSVQSAQNVPTATSQ
ncbi:MAG: hypothetical protein WC764_01525 [Candidatus Paceibacterota bacterium]